MFRRTLFVGAGSLTLLWALTIPEQASAQKGPGKGFPGGFRTGGMQSFRPTPIRPVPNGFRPGLPPAQNIAMPGAMPRPPRPWPNQGFNTLPGTNNWAGRDWDRRWGGGWPGRGWDRGWGYGYPGYWDRYGRRWPSRRINNNNNNNNNNNSSSSSSSSSSGGGSGGGGYPVFMSGGAIPGAVGVSDGAVRSSSETIRFKEPPYRATFVEDRERTTRLKLELALGTSEMSEIVTGSPLNVLLDDLRRFSGRIAVPSTPLSEDILLHANVTTTEHHGNLGLLRNGGKFSWPYALELDKVMSKQERNEMELKLQAAVQQATQGNIPRTSLAEMKVLIGAATDKVIRNGKEIPGGYYLEGKRFLEHLDAARIALENGEAPAYFAFQKWIRGGKTIQDVANYMVREGLQFAPALPGDERAYRAMHSALAAYDVAVNQESTPIASTK